MVAQASIPNLSTFLCWITNQRFLRARVRVVYCVCVRVATSLTMRTLVRVQAGFATHLLGDVAASCFYGVEI